MLGRLLLLFTVLPLVDLFLLLEIGEHIGGVATLTLVLVTGMLGAVLARAEGTRVLRAWQAAIVRGTVPPDGVVSGALILAGGAWLIAPGVITDAVGLLLLFPLTRRIAARLLVARMQRAIERGSVRVVHTQFGGGDPFWYDDQQGQGEIIDVEGEPVEPPPHGRLEKDLGNG